MLFKKQSYVFVLGLLAALLLKCTSPKNEESSKIPKKASTKSLSIHDALPKEVISPSDNLPSNEKTELGRLLFYDPILSGDKDVACATCHHPNTAYAEYRDLSIGVNGVGLGQKRSFKKPNKIPLVKRNAHTILNTAFNGINTANFYNPDSAAMFWDMRASSLEKQAIEPILAFEEMRGTHFSEFEIIDEVLKRLQNIPEYVTLFKLAFEEDKSVSQENLGKAIAAFERTLITSDTRFDKYQRGDKNAISMAEEEGFLLFKKVGCGNCHNGPMFSDFLPHVLGVPKNPNSAEFDKGINDKYAFRTASLRNLRFTAPYMHNGIFNSLEDVLEFYEDISDGKNMHAEITKPELDTLVNNIDLSVKEMRPIISFLNTLNDSNFDKEIPKTVPSGLAVGGNIY